MSSYIGCMCVFLPSLVVSCNFKALIFALFMIRITVSDTDAAMPIIKAVAREPVDIIYSLLVSALHMLRFSLW